ncbi:MAG: hypothetical protein V8S22_06555 [Lachnospiraceae bacterium]
MGEKKTNYDKTREDAEQRFLAYDQEKMIRKFQLEANEAFLYLRFVERLPHQPEKRKNRVEQEPVRKNRFCACGGRL